MTDIQKRSTGSGGGAWLPLFLLCVVVLGINQGCGKPDEKTGLPPAAEYSVPVGRLINAWVGMWNSYDLDLVKDLFLPDARVTYFSSEKEGLIRGIDAVVRHHEGFGFVRGGKDQPNRLRLEDLHQEGFGSSVVVGGIWIFERGTGEDQPPQRGPVTFVCVRENDGWRFAHLHFANYLDEE